MRVDSNKLGCRINNVCMDCGREALKLPENKGKKQMEVSTISPDICDICGNLKPCTEPRDFRWPVFEIKEESVLNKLGIKSDGKQDSKVKS